MTRVFSLSRKTIFISVFGVFTLMFACSPQQQQTPNTNQSAVNAPVNTQPAANSNQMATAAPNESEAALPVTLPLVDAMLADEAFANEAQSSLQITDEQLQKLGDVSRNAVLLLNENGVDDAVRSTKAATQEAKKKIDEILGAEKGSKFIALLQKRANEEDSLDLARPSSVPTDSRIVVNAPAYRMDIFDDGKLVKSYKIGIGYPEFPLPRGLRKASTIIFNPTWTPPDEPWVKGKLQPGKKVEAGSKDNPLGPIKIPIGLPSLIHGGKSPARLGNFASHGCVGLTNAQVQDFAMELSSLSGQPISMQDIKAYAKVNTKTKEVKLDNPVPFELRYETIMVEDGKLKIYRDVYERGTNTEENLIRVLEAFDVSFDSLTPDEQKQILAGLQLMAIDAHGDRVSPNNNGNANKSNSSKNGDGKVTKNIKGKKEVVFELAGLKGKGYPKVVGIKM